MVIRRLRTALCVLPTHGGVTALVLLGAIISSSRASGAGPFVDFDWTDHVTTSRDGYTMWARLPSKRYTGILPSHSDPVGAGAHPVVLQTHCRAPGFEASDPSSPTPTHALLYLDDHPLQPDAYTVFHPMYWILGLAGQSLERWPATARLGDTAPVATELVRRRTDYSAPRPGLDLALSAEAVLSVYEAGVPVSLEIRGREVSISASFAPVPELAEAARAMRRHCGVAPVGDAAPR